jgi:hypothetical protein
MDNPEAKKIIVNVKSVDPDAWEMARKLASKHDESLGSVVSRALRQLYNIDTGPREIMPNGKANLIPETANPPGLSEDQITARIMALAAFQQSAAAMKQARMRPIVRHPLLAPLIGESRALAARANGHAAEGEP